jgi:hypothetical protein
VKKFVSGFVVGALLCLSTSVFADSVNLIGQRVQGVFAVEQGGEHIANAVVVGGSAYAPVRALAEATGTDIKVEGKRIIMSESSTSLADLQAERDSVVAEIAKRQKNIADLQTNIIPMFDAQAAELSTNGKLADNARKTADAYRTVVAEQIAEIADLQARLSEIDAEIAAL